MSTYKFRVLIEGEKNVFRDIEINSHQNFEEFHYCILASFGFDNSQMASFYLSDFDWNKGQEISLFDMGISEGDEEKLIMNQTTIKEGINCVGCHLLYTYDFLNMWNFFIELLEISVKEKKGDLQLWAKSNPDLEINQNDLAVAKWTFAHGEIA
ncbi:MAG: hypothetical protein CVT95_09720, partial [Bacteroidetes bacterium HGW-Bacteroidetes-12]